MPSMPYSATLTGLSTTNGYLVWFPDIYVRPFSVSVGCVVNSTVSAYSVEHTFDLITMVSCTFISSNATWFVSSGIAAASTNAQTAYNYPVSAIRLDSTGGSSTGTTTMNIIQAG